MDSSSSNPTISHDDVLDRFLDAPDEFYYDCMPPTRRRQYSANPSAANLRRRNSTPHRNPIRSDLETEPSSSSSSNGFKVYEKSSEDVTESTKDLIDLPPEKDNDIVVTDSVQDRVDPIHESGEKSEESMDVTDSDRVRVGPFHEEKTEESMDVTDSDRARVGPIRESGEKTEESMDVTDSDRVRVDPIQEGVSLTEESTVTTVSDDREVDNAGSSPPELRETNQTDWSLSGLLLKAIEFQFNLIITLFKYPPLLLHWCFLFMFDPFSTLRIGRRFLTTIVAELSDMVLGTFKLSWLKDTKRMLNLAWKFGWGLFWAVYVGAVLFGLLVLSLMLGGFMINRVADKPFVLKEVLNFDYTKNSPEAFVPITSCAGVVACDGSCKESNEMLKVRGVRAIPRDHKLEITLSMTLPESEYNKNLGMFQVRVDFLSADGKTLNSIRRPCMLRFRSEPIRLVQTFLKMVPLVTGYVSEIQTLSLKLKGFAEKDIPTACLKVMIEQRAEFRPGAGIPELYDASLSLESDLPFFKKVIWKWRKTLYVWISMSLFTMELLFALVCCRPLVIPRTRSRDRPPSNPLGSR
ncbi:putative adipose-regulatory protein (Seipin) [Raphanus sativus]|nr:putative adipose-regulatory protein (Seipin) [Raphanus sativus]